MNIRSPIRQPDDPGVGKDLVEAFDEMAAYLRGEVRVESYELHLDEYPEPDVGNYPGWAITLIWLGSIALCWGILGLGVSLVLR